MAKGDFILVTVKGAADPVGVHANMNGRRVEYEFDKEGNIQWFVAKELTRGGTTARLIRFPVTEVLAIQVNQKEID